MKARSTRNQKSQLKPQLNSTGQERRKTSADSRHCLGKQTNSSISSNRSDDLLITASHDKAEEFGRTALNKIRANRE